MRNDQGRTVIRINQLPKRKHDDYNFCLVADDPEKNDGKNYFLYVRLRFTRYTMANCAVEVEEMKRFVCLLAALLVLPASFTFADSAVDVIMATGTTQAFTDEAVAVLLIGKADASVDAASGATTRDDFEVKTRVIAP